MSEKTPTVGAIAPDFTLPDETGAQVSLSQLSIGNGVILIFYRGVWCPFCLNQLTEYRDLLRISRAGVPDIVALSVETPERTSALKRELQLNYRLLSDPDKRVIEGWGLLNTREHGGIAFNATFGLDRTRKVVFRSLDTMMKRASGEAAIQAVLNPPAGSSASTPPGPWPELPRRLVLPSFAQFWKATRNFLRG